MDADIVCFRCGQALGDPPTLNTLPTGEACPACAERLLDALPPIFHSPMPFLTPEPRGAEGQEAHGEGNEPA